MFPVIDTLVLDVLCHRTLHILENKMLTEGIDYKWVSVKTDTDVWITTHGQVKKRDGDLDWLCALRVKAVDASELPRFTEESWVYKILL